MIRQLTEQDVDLVEQAYNWRNEYPYWFRESLEALNEPEWPEYWKELQDCLNFGLFDTEMYGLITLSPMGQNRFTAHISAKRGTDPEKLAYGAFQVKNWLFQNGVKEIFAWVAAKHVGLKRLCERIDLKPDTVTMIKGTMQDRLIKWERYSDRAVA